MLRPSQRHAHRLLLIAAALCAARIIMLSFAPSRKTEWSGSSLTLIAIWSALGATSWPLRWSLAGIAAWLIERTVLVARVADLWSLSLAWEVLPHALLTFSVLCCLRECGLAIRPADAPPRLPTSKQFGLRKMFTWVAGIAAISLGWRHVVAAADAVPQVLGRLRIFVEGAATSAAMTAIDLAALWIVLACPRLHWRRILWIAVAVIAHVPILRIADAFVLGRNPPWSEELIYIAGHDVLYLAPLVMALLLARGAGYRLVWARSEREV